MLLTLQYHIYSDNPDFTFSTNHRMSSTSPFHNCTGVVFVLFFKDGSYFMTANDFVGTLLLSCDAIIYNLFMKV